MAKVSFNDQAEFIEELGKDKNLVERGIVRVTICSVTGDMTPNVRHISLLAQCIVGGSIVQYKEYCGDLWGFGDADGRTKAKVEEKRKALISSIEAMGFDIRSGYVEGEAGLEPIRVAKLETEVANLKECVQRCQSERTAGVTPPPTRFPQCGVVELKKICPKFGSLLTAEGPLRYIMRI